MPTTRRQITLDKMLGGENSTIAAHLIGDGVWKEQTSVATNNGKMAQVPLLKKYMTLTGWSTKEADPHVLEGIPVDYEALCLPVVITPRFIAQLRDSGASPNLVYLPLDGVPIDGVNKKFIIETDATGDPLPTNYLVRWAHTLYAGQIWFINDLNKLYSTDGSRVIQYTTVSGKEEFLATLETKNLPMARYIDAFFDHIVVANVTFKGNRDPLGVRWSDLYRPDSWEPAQGNEADFFSLADYFRGDSGVNEITGVGKLGDTRIVFTQSMIFSMRYIGLPKIMHFAPFPGGYDIGNFFRYGLASYRDRHFFWDNNEKDFFVLSAEGIKSIGEPVREVFAAVIHPTYANQQQTTAWVVPERSQVWWSTPWVLGGQFAVCYNWRNGTWFRDFTPDQYGMCVSLRMARGLTCDELTGTADGLLGTAEGLVAAATQLPGLYGGRNGEVYQEVNTSAFDITTTIRGSKIPELVTGDRYYGDLETYKEMDGVTIHATYRKGNGVQVFLSARDHLDDPVDFVLQGVWNSSLPEGKLSFPSRIPGRIFRWKFKPIPPDGALYPDKFEWRGFVESIYMMGAEE